MSNVEAYRSHPSFKTLTAEIAKGECVVFVGAGLSIAAGLPTWSELEATMRMKAGLSQTCSGPRVADCCRAVIGEQNFNSLLREQVKDGVGPTEAHRRLATLPVGIFVTTNYDTLLEKAIQEQQRSSRVLSLYDGPEWVQLADTLPECRILKIHGCVDRTPNRLIATESDYLSFAVDHESLTTGLSAILAKRPVLFVGYSLSDWNLLAVLHHVRRITAGNATNKYYVGLDVEPAMQIFLDRRYGLYVFNVTTRTTREQALLSFFDMLIEEFQVPQWLRQILPELGGSRAAHEIDKTTPLDALSSAFDIVTRMRLALRIEKHEKVHLPMDRVMRCVTIGDLLDLVRASKEARSAAV